MKRFTDLFLEIDRTNRTAEKVAAMTRYFRDAPSADAAWAVYVLSGRKIGKAVSSRLLRQWTAEVSRYPEWLVDQCYRVVGDLSETLSLLVPDAGDGNSPPDLHEVIEEQLKTLKHLDQENQRKVIVATWARLNADQRLVFHKLLSGEFRFGISRQLMMRALAEVAGVEPGIIAHRLSGHWVPSADAMTRLLGTANPENIPGAGVPYPFMLAHPMLESPATLGLIDAWLIEWKWDGIRAQLIRRAGQTTLWSRGDESVGGAFPEVVQAASALADGTVLDGEIVAWDSATDRPMPFTALQRRLNRKTVELTFWPEVPVIFIAFDILEVEGRDVRDRELWARRELLESALRSNTLPTLRLSTPLISPNWDGIISEVANARQRAVEGVMIKRRDATYRAGRPTGLWWKLKVQPYTVDAVLIAAEPGRGRRAGLLTDYTFGVWEDDALVPIAKAYSGLTDEEIVEVDRFARRHTTARHGPVHAVEPIRVFEIGFEAIQCSSRHKSGIAVRFPRILRIRDDKKPADADRLETMHALLNRVDAPR